MKGSHRIARRRLLVAALAAACSSVPSLAAGARPRPQVEVWKDPECGCCKEWVAHLEANGFAVKVNDTGNTAARARLGISTKYASCHTALVDGYAIEGHVPARDIQRLLQERPAALGLAVRGMPVGSPGMDAEVYGGRKDAFDVLLLARDGSARVYRHEEGNRK